MEEAQVACVEAFRLFETRHTHSQFPERRSARRLVGRDRI